VRDAIGGLITDARLTLTPKFGDIHPTKVTGATGDVTAPLAIDNNTADVWFADASKDRVTVRADVGDPFNLAGFVIHSGATTDADFDKQARPKTIEVTFPGTKQEAKRITLEDTSKGQIIGLDVRGITSLVITIIDTYPSTGSDTRIAIREIEIKERHLREGAPAPSG
jgi:hypothetical protein